MEQPTLDTLRDAVARNAGGVLSLPSTGMLRHHKTRFLGAEDNGFWIEAPPGEQKTIEQLIASRQAIGVSLKSTTSRVIFTSVAREYRAQMPLNREIAVDALLVSWPEELTSVQRRVDYRVTVGKNSDVSAKAWRISEQHVLRDQPPASTTLRAQLRNLSAGGMCIICQINPEEPKLAREQRLRIVLVQPGGELLLDGRVRHVAPLPSGEFRVGVQFQKMEADIEGRRALAALSLVLGRLQREEVRRARLGLSGAA